MAVLLPLVVGAIGGSLDIPRNDDWAFREIALHFYRTGAIELNGAAAMTLVGQVFAVQPFLWVAGGDAWAFWAAGAAFDVAAIVAAYLLARRLLPPERAVLAAALLPLFPGFLAYATSFMTDVPALSMSLVCLWAGMVALGRRPVSLRWLAGSLLVGCFAFSIREFALAAPVSVIGAAIIAEPRRSRVWLGAIAIVVVCGAIAYGRSRLSGQLSDPLPHLGPIPRIRASLISIAFVLLAPAVLAIVTARRSWRAGDVAIGVGVGLFVVAFWAYEVVRFEPVQAILDNLTSPSGVPAPDYLAGGRPILFPDPIWWAVNGLALLAMVVVPAAIAGVSGVALRRGPTRPATLVRRLGSPEGILVLFIVSTATGLAWLALRWSIYDRYLWVLVPPLATLLMVPLQRDPATAGGVDAAPRSVSTAWRRASVGAPVVVLSIMSLAYLLNSVAFDAARWRAGEALVGDGVAAASVDAGYEWMGTYAPGLPDFAGRPSGGTRLTWYSGLWPEFRLCGFVSSAPVTVPQADLVGVDRSAYRLLLLAGPEAPLYSYRLNAPGCGASG